MVNARPSKPSGKDIQKAVEAKTERIIQGGFREPGSMTPAVLACLVDKIPADQIGDTIAGLLGANRTVSLGEGESVTEPDWKAREGGAKLWLSYVVGLPVQRQEIVNHTVETMDSIAAKIKGSKAARDAIRNMLDQMDAEDAKPAGGAA